MQTIGAFEAKTNFSALLQQVESGEQIIITKHGHPVAKLIPIESQIRRPIKEVIRQLEQFGSRHNLSLGGLNWKTLRDMGRRDV
ncbi:MAG: type II toxin-antitoxin system prevent-host-death family antitoxin [Gammaproteobacteria bacterium]